MSLRDWWHDSITVEQVFRFLDLSGVLLNGILGGLIARRNNFDIVGFIVLAIMTATGGGIVRDVMIQAGPPFALTDPYYLGMACTGAGIAWLFAFQGRWAQRFLIAADAVVLGVWAATGASKALTNGLGVMPAVLLGCLTAVGGSMIRDVSVGQTPAVFGGNRLYAVPAMFAAITDVVFVKIDAPVGVGLVSAVFVGATLCLLAYWRSWRLPQVEDRVGVRVSPQVRALMPRRPRDRGKTIEPFDRIPRGSGAMSLLRRSRRASANFEPRRSGVVFRRPRR
ncbi:trimeric intracellular cation channel family protein [Actinomyces vulturis]|uniref:trimeric intracellular cation channel family protein n=1 Tax=Actinomyces vulturis TaxID=1857645 RepID=UPI0009F41D90|nr:trimeric intracellular cation channel family protein [Actinomyces vulturis]